MGIKKTLLLSEGSITNSLISLNNFVPEFKKNFNIVFVTFAHSEKIRESAKEQEIKLYEIPFFDKNGKMEKGYVFAKLKEIENKIKFPLEKIMFADPEFYELYKKHELPALIWFIKIFSIYEKIILNENVQVHYTNGSDHLFNFLPHFIMKSFKRKTYTLIFVPYYGAVLTSDFLGSFTENKRVSSKINYEEYIKPIMEKPVDYVDEINLKKYFNVKIFDKIYKTYDQSIEEKKNIYRFRGNLTVKNILLFLPKTWAKKIKLEYLRNFVYEKIDSGQKYIYFPLLYTEDAQIRVKAPEYYNQYEIIRNISKNLPLKYKLIVKEHPAWKGEYSIGELKNLSKHPNVIIVNPDTSSKKIFPYVENVITINSTVGYEALFFNKPVLVLGLPFYKDFPGVIKINSSQEVFWILENKKLLALKKMEIQKGLRKSTEDMLKKTLKMDYGKLLSGKEMDEGIAKIGNFLRKIAYSN